jgi:hypothetical protein
MEVIMGYFKVLPGGTEENHKKTLVGEASL